MRVAFVGRGRVGSSLARALDRAGEEIVATLGAADDPASLPAADLVVLAVPDDVLREVAAAIRLPAETMLVHTCGSIGLDALAAHGERVGILHPAVPVAGRDQDLAGATIAITGTPVSTPVLHAVVASIGARAIEVADEDRVRYHAALVHASNHLVALAADAASLLPGDAGNALIPLLERTVANIATLGAAAALTGPVVRGDAGTVAKHLAALPPEIRASYRENARRALELARGSGRLSDGDAERVAAVLDEG